MDGIAESISSMIGLAGVQVPARARFLGSFFATTAYSSLSAGMVCGQIGAMTSTGPLLPFLVGSWLGYTAGCGQVWMKGRSEALNVADKYPKLLAHALVSEFGLDAPGEGEALKKWITSERGRMTWAILAAGSCKPHVKELEEQELQLVIDSYTKS